MTACLNQIDTSAVILFISRPLFYHKKWLNLGRLGHSFSPFLQYLVINVFDLYNFDDKNILSLHEKMEHHKKVPILKKESL